MNIGGLFAILDDVAATLDDVALMSKVAAKKTAGILGDDLAVNAGALENLCQSGSISNTQGLKDGISDRYRDNITTYS